MNPVRTPPPTMQIKQNIFSVLLRLNYDCLVLSLSLMLRPTVSWPVYLRIKHPSLAYDQIFIIVRQLQVCWCGALSLTRGRVCRLHLLLVLVSTVILGFESRGILGHILLSQIRDFPLLRLLRRAMIRWSYSTTPPHVAASIFSSWLLIYATSSHGKCML
jgi:hypothetical protein